MTIPSQEAMKPWLESVLKAATRSWELDLESLFYGAKNQFPDIMWQLEDDSDEELDEREPYRKLPVWAHKAIVYTRATPKFRERYLRSNGAAGLYNVQKRKSLIHELRGLYTADNHDVQVSNPESLLDSLRNDLFSMWNTRMYSDVCIRVPTAAEKQLRQSDDSAVLAVFPSHRFLLSSRSAYFRRHLAFSEPGHIFSSHESTMVNLTLPETHFTPASLHFILGYLYTGTLRFSGRKYDLSTAFYILKGSLYLDLPDLQQLILAEIIVKKLHGLYHASIPDHDYDKLIDGEWSTMMELGCRCRQCSRRVPRVLQFALGDMIKNDMLERGARRALIGQFGEGWCTAEFAALPGNIVHSILTNIQEMVTTSNVLPLLFAANKALSKLATTNKSWVPRIKSKIIIVRESVEELLCAGPEACFDSKTWRTITKGDKADQPHDRLEHVTEVQWTVEAILRGASRQNVSAIYRALVSSTNLPYTSRGLSALGSSMQAQLCKHMMEMKLPPLVELASVSALSPQTQPLASTETNSVKSSVGSFYSCISTPASVLSLAETTNAAYNAYVAALDLASSSSLYSLASSRTITTDYGLYYTRWAISQETIQDGESTQNIARRRSWDSFRNQME